MNSSRELGAERTPAPVFPTPWLVEGSTVYELEPYGWHKGVQQFRNRWSAGVQSGGGTITQEEAEGIALQIAQVPALAAEIEKFRAENAELREALERCAEDLQVMRAKHEPAEPREDYDPALNTSVGQARSVLSRRHYIINQGPK